MLSKEAKNGFLKDGYTLEEVDRIEQGLRDIEEGNVIPFEDVIKEFFPDNKIKKEKNMYKIIITNNARNNISFIQTYIGEYSQIVLLKIFHTISHLSYFPKMGFVRNDLNLEIIDSKYKFRIIYKIDEKKKNIYIVAIFKKKQNYN